MIFKNFHEKTHYRNDDFQENRENPIYGEFVEIHEFTLVIIFELFHQK